MIDDTARKRDYVEIGACSLSVEPAGARGITGGMETTTLAIPISYIVICEVYDENEDAYIYSRQDFYDTNADANIPWEKRKIIPYIPGRPGTFDQKYITNLLEKVTLSVPSNQPTHSALDLSRLTQELEPSELIAHGSNNGYAVFENLPVAMGLTAGASYPVNLMVMWKAVDGEEKITLLTVYISVVGYSTPMLYGANGIIVFTYKQLRDVVQNNVQGYSNLNPVYLGYCPHDAAVPPGSWETPNGGEIEYEDTRGITVARDITIVGTDPRNKYRMKLIDAPSAGCGAAICAGTSDITLTLKNVDAHGNNYYGLLSNGSKSNVMTDYIDVTYAGCQIAYNMGLNSKVSFKDCRVKIENSYCEGRQFAEARAVVFYGKNRIEKTTNKDFTLCLYGNGSLTVARGAHVTVNTTNCFLYGSGGITAVIDGALELTNKNSGRHFGSMVYDGHSIAALQIGRNGSLIMHNNRPVGSSYGCVVANSLMVRGKLEIINAFPGDFSCIYLNNITGSYNFVSPEFVKLSNGAGSLVSGSGTLKMNNISVLNRQTTEGKKFIWNNKGMDNETFSVTATPAAVNRVSNLTDNGTRNEDRGVAIAAPRLNTNNFPLNHASSEIIFGKFGDLSIDPVYRWGTTVAGTAPAGSLRSISEQSSPDAWITFSEVQNSPAVVDGNQYSLTMRQEIGQDTRVYVKCIKNDRLEAHTYADRHKNCMFSNGPKESDFASLQIPPRRQFVKRAGNGWTITVRPQNMDAREKLIGRPGFS